MALPAFPDVMKAILEICADRKPRVVERDLADAVGDRLNVSVEDRALKLRTGRGHFANRVAWACSHLVQAGLLSRPGRGLVAITNAGLEVVRQKPDRVDRRYLIRFPPYAAWMQRSRSRLRQPRLSATRVEGVELAEQPAPATKGPSASGGSRHTQLKQALVDIGRILGKEVHEEFRELPHVYDVIWKEYEGAPRASHVFEVQDRGNLIETLAKLQHARDIWGAAPFLVVTEEKDRERALQQVRPLLAGTFHRLAPHLVVTGGLQVQVLHRALQENAELVRRMIQG